MKKRLLTVLSVILTFLMLGSTSAFAANVAPVQSDKFTDVSAGDWYKEYVDFVASNGYMIGTSETTFEPQTNLTRAMFATILARYDKADVDDSKATIFNDVPVDQWYTGSIGWANEKEIVKGYGDGNFGTNDSITRQDLSLMIVRYISFYEKEHKVKIKTHGGEWNGDITFTDESDIRQDTETPAAIKALVNYGVLLGYPDGTVKPTQNITRAETAAIMKRLDWILTPPTPSGGTTVYKVTYHDYLSNDTVKNSVYLNQKYTVKDFYEVFPNAGVGFTFEGWDADKDGKVDYQKGDTITIKGNYDLYPVCTTITAPEYEYTVGGTVKAGEHQYDLTPVVYSGTEADTKAIEDIAKELVDKNSDITTTIQSGLEKLAGEAKTTNKDGYTITTTADNEIKVDGVNLGQKMKDQVEIYRTKMGSVKEKSGITSDKWDAFVEAFSPEVLFTTLDSETLTLKDADGYYNALKDAVYAAADLYADVRDTQDIKAVLEAAEEAGGAAGLDVKFADYIVDDDLTVTSPDDVKVRNDRIADLLATKEGILPKLKTGDEWTYVAFSASETPNSPEDVWTIINERTSRDFSSDAGIKAIIKAVQKAYVGKEFSVEITVTKEKV